MPSLSDEQRHQRAATLRARVERLVPTVPYLTYDAFCALTAARPDVLLIDTRESEEVAVSTLPHSQPLQHARRSLPHSPDDVEGVQGDDSENARHNVENEESEGADSQSWRTRPIVCFCTVGLRSGIEAGRLRSRGFAGARNYSLMEHVWGGGDVVRHGHDGSDAVVHAVHVYEARYADVMPQRMRTEAFGPLAALLRGIPTLPGLLTAAAASRRWQRQLPDDDDAQRRAA